MPSNQLILLVEDNPDDVELTMRALKKNRIATEVVVVRHGVEALDFLFASGAYSGRNADDPARPGAARPQAAEGRRTRGAAAHARRRAHAPAAGRRADARRTRSRTSSRPTGSGVNSYVRKPVDFDRFNELLQHLGRYWLEFNESPTRRRASRPA